MIGVSAYHGDMALAGDRLGVSIANGLKILDRAGNYVGGYTGMASQVGSPPLADPEGNFYFATIFVNSVGPDGKLRWNYPMGENLDKFSETTHSGRMLLSPEGLLYVPASDGFLYILNAADGKLKNRVPIGMSSLKRVLHATVGVGDTFFLWDREGRFSTPYDALTGAPAALPRADGKPLIVLRATWAGLIAEHGEYNGDVVTNNGHFLDSCMQVAWSLPNDGGFWSMQLVRHDNTLAVGHYPSGKALGHEAFGYLFSAEGKALLGPKPLRGYFMAAGADGLLYTLDCSEWGTLSEDLSIHCYSSSLEELWSVHLGTGCDTTRWGAATLADDGVMYMPRVIMPDSLELVAIQTQSPGLAKSPMPTNGFNNRRTGWLAVP